MQGACWECKRNADLGLHLGHVVLAHAHGVEGTARVANGVSATEHALEADERALFALRARLLEVHPSLDLDKVHREELDGEERREGDGGPRDRLLAGLVPTYRSTGKFGRR